MQAKNSTNLDFSSRTDRLAAKLEVDLGDLPEVLGFSRASLFGYRSGKAPITGKAWRKLEQAEREAGLLAQEDREALKDLPDKIGDALLNRGFKNLQKIIFDFVDDSEALGVAVLENKISKEERRVMALDITGRSGHVRNEWLQTFEMLGILSEEKKPDTKGEPGAE